MKPSAKRLYNGVLSSLLYFPVVSISITFDSICSNESEKRGCKGENFPE